MATSLKRSMGYPVTAGALHRAFTTDQFWRDRVAEVGGDRAAVKSVDISTAGVTAVTVQYILAENLPSMVAAIHPGDIEIVRTEIWGPLAAAAAAGSFSAQLTGAPAKLEGTLSLHEEDGRAIITAAGSAEVKLPFVAGKIESAVVENLEKLFERERDFTEAWIAQHN